MPICGNVGEGRESSPGIPHPQGCQRPIVCALRSITSRLQGLFRNLQVAGVLFSDLILIMSHRRAAKSRIADPDGADVPIALRSLIFCSGAVKADRAWIIAFGLDPTYLVDRTNLAYT